MKVVSIGSIDGGQAGNVIPETVKFGGTFRFMTSEGFSYLRQRIKEVLSLKEIFFGVSSTLAPKLFLLLNTDTRSTNHHGIILSHSGVKRIDICCV